MHIQQAKLCSPSGANSLDHAVQLVGYGTDNGEHDSQYGAVKESTWCSENVKRKHRRFRVLKCHRSPSLFLFLPVYLPPSFPRSPTITILLGQDYWWVRNSWNTDWGEEGYIRLARGDGVNACGVADQPLFADFLTNYSAF